MDNSGTVLVSLCHNGKILEKRNLKEKRVVAEISVYDQLAGLISVWSVSKNKNQGRRAWLGSCLHHCS